MAYFIEPYDTTEAQILSGPAEDPTAAWTSGTYAVGDERHVVATHRVYKSATAGSSTVSPELDPDRWQDMRPTARWAPFDVYTSSAITQTSNITYSLSSRFVNSVALYGLDGKEVTLTVKDSPGGTVLYTKTVSLKAPATGYWDYAYGRRKKRNSLIFTGLPIGSTATIDVTVSADGTSTRKLGMLVRGKLVTIKGRSRWGGTLAGATVTPKTYTYRKTNNDGTVDIVPRSDAKNLSFTVVFDRQYADTAVIELAAVMSKPVPWILSLQSGFGGLTTFGIGESSPMKYENKTASCDISVEGYI